MRYAILVVLALTTTLGLADNANAQATRDYEANFGAVTTWNLSFTTTRSGSGTYAVGPFGDKYTWNISETITGNITLTKCQLSGCVCPTSPNGTVCDGGSAQVTTAISDTITTPRGEIPQTILHTAGGSYTPKFAEIDYNFTENTYLLRLDTTQPSGQVLYDGAPIQTGLDWGCDGSILHLPGQVPFPTSGLALTGNQSVQGSPCGFELPNTLDLTAGTVQSTWTLTPVMDLDLQVSIPEYDNWRPTGGKTEKETGADASGGAPNNLLIQAQIIVKSTGQFLDVPPDKFIFKLTQVSHEPGVVGNWPLPGVATADPDITFEPEGNQGFTITDPATEEYDNPPFSLIFGAVSPHDWGGWATLNVDAVVNGTTIHGHLQLPPPAVGDPNATDILLPQRQLGSMIADSWKNQFNIPLDKPDDDDSEDSPKGDNGVGDGLTLYEEYRGFYMGCSGNNQKPGPEGNPGTLCQHVEGDPTRKDLFVVDTIKASQSIDDFASAANLNVHYHGLKLAEVGPANDPPMYRVINFNHSKGAHEVPQHAIVITWSKTQPENQSEVHSQVVTTDSYVCVDGSHSCPALPKDIDHVEIAPQFKAIMAKIGAAATNNRRDFAWSVEHELSHTVDVYHHGDAGHEEYWSLDPRTGVLSAIYSTCGAVVSLPIVVVPETSDFAYPTPSNAAKTSDLIKLGFGKTGRKALTNNGVPLPGQWVPVGNDLRGSTVIMNGRHSGDTIDFMRYADTAAYIPAGLPNVRVWIGPGSEILGAALTDQIIGTGVNDPNRMINNRKRVRYGDADANKKRGNNMSMIDVNDNHTEIVRPVQKCP